VTSLEGEEIVYFREKIQIETTVGCLEWFAMLIAHAKGLKDLASEVEEVKGQVSEELLGSVLLRETIKLVTFP